MKISILLGTLAAFLLACAPASAQVLVSEGFESYADDTALYSVWEPRIGNGNGPPSAAYFDAGILIDENYTDPFAADPGFDDTGARAFPEGGHGVDHIGGGPTTADYAVMQYLPDLATLNGGNPLVPTAAKSILLQGDIFDTYASGNKRMTIGLRNRSVPENIVELGFYNSDSIGYAYRGILFPTVPEEPNPNWGFFELPIGLDRPEGTEPGQDEDEIVSIGDIGEAWHTFRAIITPDTITFEIDLYRDGVRNDTPTTTSPGVDATITIPNLTTTSVGFDSLRIGGPSGLSSGGGGVVFDNILLELIDAAPAPLLGDYNGNGIVDAADYTVYRDTLGLAAPDGNGSGADGNNDGFITLLDYPFWADNFGNSSTSNASAVPEPTTILLACFAGLALTGLRRQA